MPQSTDSSAYHLFHEGVQRWLREERWTELRTIQEAAARPILEGERDVIISAVTAGGKTEAAFLPIASNVAAEWEKADLNGLSVLYISPLKALINDQFGRLRDLFEPLHVPVFRWHGDVSSSKKRRAREEGGVLLITPESLEAQFIRRGYEISDFLRPLRYVVIDELHAFMGTERGKQLQSLLHRVELAARRQTPRIALSATLGDMEDAKRFLRPGAENQVELVDDPSQKQSVRLQVRGYEHRRPENEEASHNGEAAEESSDLFDIADHLLRTLRGTSNITFANARQTVEVVADILRRRCHEAGIDNEFLPHHGNLSRALREEAEEKLRSKTRPATIIATTTLELGIDVGVVDAIAQVGPPPSVSSMRQRLGRSGRTGEPAVLRVYVRESALQPNSSVSDRLRMQLVQTVAMVRLLVRTWNEPPITDALHLSTLVQQVLSLIAQHGGITAQQGYDVLCRQGPFREVSVRQYMAVLKDLGNADLITQTHDGTLVLDLTGERLINHFDFYAAFSRSEEYRLMTGGTEIGSLPILGPLSEGTYLIFGGKRWKVVAVHQEERRVELVPAKGGRAPRFGGMGAGVHHMVRREMKRVYEGDESIAFLDPNGEKLLREGRRAYQEMGLHTQSFFKEGESVYWFPWIGDRALNAIELALRSVGENVANDGGCLRMRANSVQHFANALRLAHTKGMKSAVDLASLVENKATEKHHVYLRDELLAADYESQYLDVERASETLGHLLRDGRPRSSGSMPTGARPT